MTLKNVKPSQVVTSIVMCLDEFRDLVYDLCGTENIDIDYDGTDLTLCGQHGDSSDIIAALNKHFDINIETIHTDNSEYIGVWISFKEKSATNV